MGFGRFTRTATLLAMAAVVAFSVWAAGSVDAAAGPASTAQASPSDLFATQDWDDVADDGGGNGYVLTSSRWQTMPINVCWENIEAATAEHRQLVIDGAEAWAVHGELSFSGWDSCEAGDDGIRILWQDSGPHVKGLGNRLDGMTNGMVLNNVYANWSPSCQNFVDYCTFVIAVHEFGHALGIAHEQNRPDTPTDPDICSDAPQGTNGDVTVGPWDLESVMNYCNPTWSNAGVLSAGDITTIQYLYPSCGDGEATFCPIPPRSDFDGDGYDDLVVGIPGEQVNGLGTAGAVLELPGSATGLSTSIGEIWTQDSGSIADTAEPGDQAGGALAIGDFDGDGYHDLAMGAPGEGVGIAGAAGAVNVIYGGASGLSDLNDLVLHQDAGSVDDTAASGDMFGAALTVGDFNGDDRDDLAVGVPGESVGGIADAGLVTVFYGSDSGLSENDSDTFHQGMADVPGTTETGSRMGLSLSAGDFDGDGRDELVIGVPGASVVADEPGAGQVIVLDGTPEGVGTTGAQLWHQNSAGSTDPAEAGDSFGAALTVGDFTGNGYDDLAVGVPGEDDDAGAVVVMYGTATGLAAIDEFWDQNTGDVPGTMEAGDRFGEALAAGDFDGDDRDDLAIGAPDEAIGQTSRAGWVGVIYGSTNGLTSQYSDGFSQSSGLVEDSQEEDDAFGAALSVGDFNGDGKHDLAVGIPGEGVSGAPGVGAVWVVHGSVGGLVPISNAFLHQGVSSPGDENQTGDRFGVALAGSTTYLGHTTCDGRLATIIAAPGGLTQGSPVGDVIAGSLGNDQIDAGDGNDTICGADGNDTINGGGGTDRILGQGGKDVIDGGPDLDRIWGGGDADTINGGEGDDVIRGNGGNDVLSGGPGIDRIFGNSDNDTINGDDGDDRLFGNSGHDEINGGLGADSLYGHSGDDEMNGGEGDDLGNGSSGQDEMNGGDGADILRGGSDDDTINGGAGSGDISGGQGGDDTLIGGDGENDLCRGDSHDDGDTADATCENVRLVP